MDSLSNLYAHREALAWSPAKKSLPVTLVTGFLGSGKTTLLTHVLQNRHNLKIAAAVNDFAEVNIDGQIVRGTKGHGEVVELSNGCLCCSVSGEFKNAVWKLLEDADIGKIDYLMVETSGVTDPQRTIATLEQKYGKMYRVRLDAVVTVVDTDVLATKLAGGAGEDGLGSVAADSQLRCADVVLLNKMDLVSKESLHEAKEFVERLVPGVQVYSCKNCAVPLHWIMEVSEVSRGLEVVSHEVTEAAYTISEMGGVMNASRQSRTSEKKGNNCGDSETDHLSTDEFVSVVFESSIPLTLSGFQAILGTNFPAGLLRMKGTVWFKENVSCLYSFHMSGRHRYEISTLARRGDSLEGAFSVQLVAIGKGMDVGHVRTLLDYCLAEKEKLEAIRQESEFAKLVAEDDRFQLIDSPVTYNTPASTYIDFRLTGCVEYGVSEEEASRFHGIDFNRMNAELARRVNGSLHRVSLLPVLLSSGLQVCRHSMCSEAGLEKAWTIIQEVANGLIEEFYLAVGFCKCGR